MRAVSPRRAKENRLRAKVLAEMRAEYVPCEMRLPMCTGRAVDWDERLTRARGGSVTDPANRIMACRLCHDWKTTHPLEAHELGLMPHAWES